MRYVVSLAGREFQVDVDGERVLVDGREVRAHLSPVPGTPLRHLVLDTESVTLALEARGLGAWHVMRRGTGHEVEVVDERTHHIRSLTAEARARSGPAHLKAPMPGLVVRILVAPGEMVEAGQGVVVLEAMKMENELRATGPGVVRAITVAPGQAVEKGAVLVEFSE